MTGIANFDSYTTVVIDKCHIYTTGTFHRIDSILTQVPDHDVVVSMNASLFEWVIENLCKNAVVIDKCHIYTTGTFHRIDSILT
ncbi:MAG: hypothetical protein K6A90_14490, partial [Lachnospiraceae bacterium]|nr:hypothetical protein [Lachnospiraceae bacterium]